MNAQTLPFHEPPLLLGERTEAALRSIAASAMARAPEVAALLLDEVDRAEVVSESALPDDVVTLGSRVTYQVQLTGAIRTIQLVRPQDADPAALRVSVVSAVGAALIGLKPGQRIAWELGGRRQVLEVLWVSRPVA